MISTIFFCPYLKNMTKGLPLIIEKLCHIRDIIFESNQSNMAVLKKK